MCHQPGRDALMKPCPASLPIIVGAPQGCRVTSRRSAPDRLFPPIDTHTESSLSLAASWLPVEVRQHAH